MLKSLVPFSYSVIFNLQQFAFKKNLYCNNVTIYFQKYMLPNLKVVGNELKWGLDTKGINKYCYGT